MTSLCDATATGDLGRVSMASRSHCIANLHRLSHILNNNVMGNSIILLDNSPKVKGSAVLLRIYGTINGSLDILCMSNRRSTIRVGVHTREVNIGNSGIGVVASASIRTMYRCVGSRGPSLIVVSSVRAVAITRLSSSTKDVIRIERDAGVLLHAKGDLRVPVFVMDRIGGNKSVTNPGIVRRVISAILCFRNRHGRTCEVLHTVGGHFNSAGRVNIFRVKSNKLVRIRGPSTRLLSNEVASISNKYVAYVVRNAEPVLSRIRTLMAAANFNGPHHASANFSCGHLDLVLTILRGHVKLCFSGLSTCLGVVNNVGVSRPTTSLTMTLTLISNVGSMPVSSGVITFNRVNLSNRMESISHTGTEIDRTTHLNFAGYVLPGTYLGRVASYPTSVALIKIEGLHRTVTTIARF